MNEEILEQIGLSRNEAKVYFALLELEQSSATPIVKKASIPNSKVYQTLDKLIKKGLASYVIKNNVRYFQASDPKNLIEFLNNKEKQIELQKEAIEKLMPQIEMKKRLAKEKQEAEIYEGPEGVKAAFNNLLNSLNKNEEYCVFTLGEELGSEQLVTFFQNYHKKRIQKKIKARLIANIKIKDIIKQHHIYPDMQFRFTAQNTPAGIFIFNDKVMTVVWGEVPTAFVIHSKENTQHYREFFEEVWRSGSQ